MNDEYIIVNKTTIEKRIEELENVIEEKKIGVENERWLKHELKQILSQSTPLIPEIKKAWKDGRDGTKVVGNFPFIGTQYINKTSQDYISKLDI